jgi:hypothetical protein
MKVLMHALAASCEELRPMTGNPPLVRGEGTNSSRLFTPGASNALAMSKVHQIPWAHGYDPKVEPPR